MKGTLITVLMAGCFAVGVVPAQTLDLEISGLADKLSKTLVAKGAKNVAAIDFTDLQGQPTELGRFLSERLAIELVSTAGVSMLDRANIKSILAEHKLTEEGLVNPANAKKLGEFAGVDTILIGNVTPLDDGIELMVKAIATESAKIIAAGRAKFPKTSEIQQLLNRSVSGSSVSGAPPVSAREGSGAAYQDATAIATKDIGSLRVILKTAMPMKVSIGGQRKNGVRCTFEMINRETQRPIAVAMNADPATSFFAFISERSNEEMLKSTLLDENGGIWKLVGSALTGLSTVRAGRGWNGSYPSTDIVRLLEMRERLNSDRDPSDPGNQSNQFIYGSTTPIEPGQSLKITMDFIANEAGGPLPKVIQINGEIIVGVATNGTRKSYSLHNLTFDRVSMTAL